MMVVLNRVPLNLKVCVQTVTSGPDKAAIVFLSEHELRLQMRQRSVRTQQVRI